MALYVRHSAWLNAIPETKEPQQGAPRAKSRREAMEDNGITPGMPPLEWGEYLIGYLFEFGPSMAAGMGCAPISASEIESWQRLLGVEFHPWESRLLRRLSCEYTGESALASKPDRPAPFETPEDIDRRLRAEVRRMDSFLE